MPCTKKRACILQTSGRARVHHLVPFVMRLIDRSVDSCVLQPLCVKLDPGSKFTGLAVVREVEFIAPNTGEITSGVAVLNLFELVHRGRQISEALHGQRFKTRREAKDKTIAWLLWYNRTRLHSTLAYVSPV